MLQSTTARTISPQLLFPLNIENVKHLFPGFLAGDFAVIHGSSSLSLLSSLLCIRAQLPPQLGGLGSNVIFVDGKNTFRLYQTARLAQLHQLDPQQVLERIYISRAFTAHQMVTLMTETFKEAVKQFGAKLTIISDIAATFLDKDIDDEEACTIYKHSIANLTDFARENQLIIIAIYPPHPSTYRSDFIKKTTCEASNVIIEFKQTKYRRLFILEKHHTLSTGTMEFPSENPTLDDFTSG